MPSGLFPPALDCVTGAVDYDTDTFYVQLLQDTYTPDFDAHDRRDDGAASECPATGGYVAGGFSVTVSVAAFNTTSNKRVITLGGVTIPASTITARYARWYKRRGGAASADELIGASDFGENKISSSGDFIVNSATFELELNAA